MIVNYFHLIKSHSSFFVFSIGGVFFSAPGQTFLISLAIPNICASFSISAMTFASIYSLATLLASFTLPKIGAMIDKLPVKKMILINTISFGTAICLLVSTSYVPLLFVSIYFLRLFGQGALTLTASSHTIKQFQSNREVRLALLNWGIHYQSLCFRAYFFLMGWLSWQGTFLIFGLLIFTCYSTATLWGIRNAPIQHQELEEKDQASSKPLSYVLKDKFFPFYVSLSSIPPIMMTAAFYFQVTIFSSNAWAIEHVSIGIFCYALTKFFSTIVVGPFIDRYGIVFPLFLLTFLIGIATCLIAAKGPISIAYLYYALYGIGIGASATTMNYLWSLLYGSNFIGEIKGFIAILRNGGTAISPILFSFFLHQLNIDQGYIFLISGALIILLSIAPFILRIFDQRIQPKRDKAL